MDSHLPHANRGSCYCSREHTCRSSFDAHLSAKSGTSKECANGRGTRCLTSGRPRCVCEGVRSRVGQVFHRLASS